MEAHFGQLMSICSEKFSELAATYRKLKGRIVFRGDIGKDENGAAALCQELAAAPTSVQGLIACVAYGIRQGIKLLQLMPSESRLMYKLI